MLADLVLLLHVLIVGFNVLGLVAIWIGAGLGWQWVRNRAFRIAHIVVMAFIAAEALLGVMCPLTVWEDALRGEISQRGFVSRWLAALLYWDWPTWVFTLIYCAWFGLVVLAWFMVRPHAAMRGK